METRKRWTMVIIGILIGLMIGISAALAASDYPTRYIDLVVPYSPGGATDGIARLYKDRVEKLLGQPFSFVYKPGAGGTIAGSYVKESKPDGYVLLAISNASMVLSQITRKAGYTLDDFTPVCSLTFSATIFCVKKDSPYKTMKDFFQAAKTKKMRLSTTGTYASGHLFLEAIGKEVGFEFVAVPMNGGAEAQTAVLGGHVDMSVSSPSGVENQLRILAVVLKDRWEIHPEVPTLVELGYPFAHQSYFSLFAPKGVPKEIVDKLYGAYKKTLEEDREEITKRAKGIHQIARVIGPEELGKVSWESYDFFKSIYSKMKTPVK